MVEILQITSVIVGLKNALDIAKLIYDSDASLAKAEAKMKLVELMTALSDAKITMASIQEAVAEKDTEIKRLKRELETRESLVWEPPYYFTKIENGRDGPYCQNCYDSDSKLIRLQPVGSNDGYWMCHNCDSRYKDSNYTEPNYAATAPNRRKFIEW